VIDEGRFEKRNHDQGAFVIHLTDALLVSVSVSFVTGVDKFVQIMAGTTTKDTKSTKYETAEILILPMFLSGRPSQFPNL
jgi:hypothetical protein